MTDSERKKIRNKAKKAEVKSKVTEVITDTIQCKVVKEDPFGLQFVIGVDHLEEATKFLKPLLRQSSMDIEVLELGCRVYFAKRIEV